MYYFKAHYTHMMTCEPKEITIKLEEQFFHYERDIYIEAMRQAYDKTPVNYSFDGIEFICC